MNNIIIDNFINLGVRTWLNVNCSKINIKTLKIITNNKFFGKIDEIYLEATNLIYQNLYINKIIIKIYDCYLRFNYKNQFIYSEDLMISSLLTIDNRNLESLFFERKWKSIRIKIQDSLIDGNKVSNLKIKNNLINLNYEKNNLNLETNLSLKLINNYIFIENLKNNKKMKLPVDEKIKFNSFEIKNKLIRIDLLSKVIFGD